MFQETYFEFPLVLPFGIEGFSIRHMEAMSFGNCVLVSDIEENIEAIGQAGFTFKTKCVDDLEIKLRKLILNENQTMTYRDQAKQHVLSSYDWETTTDQFEELYYSLIK